MFTISKDTERRRKKWGRTEFLGVTAISVEDRERDVGDEAELAKLADSMAKQGLESPITVRLVGDLTNPEVLPKVILVAGARRLAAAKLLGWDVIECHVHVNMTDDEAKMVELAENRFREELPKAERARWFKKWTALHDKQADDKLTEVRSVSTGGRGKKGGVRAAAREAGIPLSTAQELDNISKLSDEALSLAKELGFGDHNSVLKGAAKVQKEGGDPVAFLKAEAAKRAGPRKPVTKVLPSEEGTEAPNVTKFRVAKTKRMTSAWKGWIAEQVRQHPDADPFAAIAEGLAAAGYAPPAASAPATAPHMDDLAPVTVAV